MMNRTSDSPQLNTPVIFLIFNRPDTTAQVFAEIARARPRQLLVVADGPRPERPDDREKCAAARAVIEQIDWECQLMTAYAETNMGCRNRVSSGLDWAFDQVEEAIILEDDCVPDQTFFRFAEEMLLRFRDSSQVMQISGYNLLESELFLGYSYCFSHWGFSWGWATWRRAWQQFDCDMRLWPTIQRDGLDHVYPFTPYIRGVLEKTYQGYIDTWDYQWQFAKMINSGISVIPTTNLIQNVGFRDDATHTTDENSSRAHARSRALTFPLKHPEYIFVNHEYDRAISKSINAQKSMTARVRGKIRQIRRNTSNGD